VKILHHIDYLHSLKHIGNKAVSLIKMHKLGFRVPDSFVIPQQVRDSFAMDPDRIRQLILNEVDQIAGKHPSWAIRSSSSLEDLEEHSFAGQFTTLLDVQGSQAMLEAIEQVWDSANRFSGNLYPQESEQPSKTPDMSVIVQEMIHSTWSGVAFSINPVNGRNEIIIEAVEGRGDKLVQEGVRPHRYTWYQQAWDSDLEPEGEIKEVLDSLVVGIQKLHKEFRAAVDIEWAYDGQDLYYLQCRPVSASEFPTIYSNHISREVLPGLIKPLIWSVNIPLVNSAWIRLLEGLLGKLGIRPEQLSKSFHYRAYFNMGTLGGLFKRMGLPNDSLESLMGRKSSTGKSSFKPGLKTLRYLPSMLGFLLSNLFLKKKFLKAFGRISKRTDELQEGLNKMPVDEYNTYFKKIHQLASEAAYYNIIIPLSFQISNQILQKKLKKRGIALESLDFLEDFPALNSYDPNEAIKELQGHWTALPEELRQQMVDVATFRASKTDSLLKEFVNRFDALIDQFGHFSESGNDFSSPPWRENPDFLFKQVLQLNETASASKTRTGHYNSGSARIPRKAYLRAGRFRLYREMISSEYTRCYGLFRYLFLKTGQSFVDNGWLVDSEDIFYLTLNQHNQLFEGVDQDALTSIRDMVDEVKKEMEECREVVLPSIIYGETPPPLVSDHSKVFEGIPTSPGIFEGELVVVKSYEDFEKEVEGKILVIPYSDVGWTPLLIRAGAIVSESGGILSHASIIARELSIPAISSVDHACTLEDGINGLLDGYQGKLILNN
jgi:pyruvate,water dikinase